MVDLLVVVFVGLAALFGFIRGIVSQLMGIAGLVAAVLLAPLWGGVLADPVQRYLGCSKFMAGKLSILLLGILIYVGFRLGGYGIERILVRRSKEMKSLNRLGGAALGTIKAGVIVGILFSFLALIPRSEMRGWFPKLLDSRTYKLAANYNPMGKQPLLEKLRGLRTVVADPKKMDRLKDSDEIEKLFSRYELKGALDNKQFVKTLEEGDYDSLSKNEQVEKLMNDDQLSTLLENLEKEPIKK